MGSSRSAPWCGRNSSSARFQPKPNGSWSPIPSSNPWIWPVGGHRRCPAYPARVAHPPARHRFRRPGTDDFRPRGLGLASPHEYLILMNKGQNDVRRRQALGAHFPSLYPWTQDALDLLAALDAALRGETSVSPALAESAPRSDLGPRTPIRSGSRRGSWSCYDSPPRAGARGRSPGRWGSAPRRWRPAVPASAPQAATRDPG